MSRVLRRLWQAYTDSLVSSPIASRCATAAAGAVLGDTIAQSAEASSSGAEASSLGHDYLRTLRLVTYNVAFTPVAYRWFHLLDTRIYPNAPRTPRAVLAKIVIDQSIMAPTAIAAFFVGMKVLEGKPEQALPALEDSYLQAMRANYALWPAMHVLNFSFVPPSQRILFLTSVSVLWTALMSHLAAGGRHHHGEEAGVQDGGAEAGGGNGGDAGGESRTTDRWASRTVAAAAAQAKPSAP